MSERPDQGETESIRPDSDPRRFVERFAEQCDEPQPIQIGPYRILQTLGEGGMGVVYLAEQEKPIRRRVALKIIKLGMDTKQVVARFDTEREALALMNHANVAKVFDAGATEQGRPYFAMEYVPGIPITDYCDKQRLTTKERLVLFMDVCHAVQHAHQKGIIHRDIKPGNVLVMVDPTIPAAGGHPLIPPFGKGGLGGGAVKIIDFGVAKATQHRLTEHTVFTEQGQLIGTPGYMSPEQAEMTALDIDTRTDIYSLGVLLYELLVGARPFDDKMLIEAGFAEIQRVIREVDPPKPSTKLSSFRSEPQASACADSQSPDTARAKARGSIQEIAKLRHTEPATLVRQIRGDLDWIVMKCLEKNRTRRYDSAGSLAAEIEHYLNGEAVLAAPPSAVYRLQKFVRRHRAGVAAGATITAALVIGLGAALLGLRSAKHARDAEATARREAESARQVASENERRATDEAAKSRAAFDFVTEMFGAVDPVLARGHDVTVAEVLNPAAEKVGRAFADDPEGEAVVRGMLGQAYAHLARYPDALREFDRAWELRRSLGQDDDPQTLALLHDLGTTVLETGDVARARGLLQRTWEQRSAKLGKSHRDTLATRSVLAFAKQLDGDLDGATSDIRSVLADQERHLGPSERDTLESMCSLADMLESAGKAEEAMAVAHEAARRASSAYGAESNLALTAASIEAELLQTLGRYEEAAALLEQVVTGKEKLYGQDHPGTLVSLDLLARALGNLRQDDRAIALSRLVVDRATRALGERHSATLTYMNNLAQALRQAGRLDEAEPIYRDVLTLRRETSGEHAQETLVVMSNLGLLLMQRNAPSDALPLFRDALEGLKKALPPGHWMLGVAMLNLGRCQTALGEYAAAEETLSDSYALMKGSLGATHGRTLQARTALADLYDAWGKPDQARAWRAPN